MSVDARFVKKLIEATKAKQLKWAYCSFPGEGDFGFQTSVSGLIIRVPALHSIVTIIDGDKRICILDPIFTCSKPVEKLHDLLRKIYFVPQNELERSVIIQKAQRAISSLL